MHADAMGHILPPSGTSPGPESSPGESGELSLLVSSNIVDRRDQRGKERGEREERRQVEDKRVEVPKSRYLSEEVARFLKIRVEVLRKETKETRELLRQTRTFSRTEVSGDNSLARLYIFRSYLSTFRAVV
jgi:hypothetical protein